MTAMKANCHYMTLSKSEILKIKIQAMKSMQHASCAN